jgi:hypothetical protein
LYELEHYPFNAMELTDFSLEPPPKKAIDSACVRSLECMNLEINSSD